jgi:hypothetical protein
MKLGFLAMVAVTMALAGCSESADLTGMYGGGVVGGTVVMADGGSPVGVQVSVAGTGMSMVVGEDGAFGFANVPEQAQLVLRRGPLAGSVEVAAGSTALTVQLGPVGAAAIIDNQESEIAIADIQPRDAEGKSGRR